MCGDSRMLVAGGVDDQPAGRWLASRKAGWYYGIWKQIKATKPGDIPKFEDDDEKAVYMQIVKIKAELAAKGGSA